jgi:hypothetical protein
MKDREEARPMLLEDVAHGRKLDIETVSQLRYTLECSPMSSHDHMILLIRNLLDTPLHVYKPLEPHQIGINQFVILLFAHRDSFYNQSAWANSTCGTTYVSPPSLTRFLLRYVSFIPPFLVVL